MPSHLESASSSFLALRLTTQLLQHLSCRTQTLAIPIYRRDQRPINRRELFLQYSLVLGIFIDFGLRLVVLEVFQLFASFLSLGEQIGV